MFKIPILIAFMIFSFSLRAQVKGQNIISSQEIGEQKVVCPLSLYSAEFNKPQYALLNTAANVKYMNKQEKDVIWILNILTSYPKLFAELVVKKYPERSGDLSLKNDKYYFQSLLDTLNKVGVQLPLQPSQKCYESAHCHASSSGVAGYTGHERQSKACTAKKYYNGECADYGRKDPVDIVLSLLIDEGVPSLGHRSICLMGFKTVGVSIQPHKVYGTNAVLDFKF